MQALGGDPTRINPLLPAELVIDHSVQVDEFGTPEALALNAQIEFARNQERYAFLRWGQRAFRNFAVVPPDTGIVHQVNLEYLARVVFTAESKAGPAQAYPDTLVGTDSHTTMINGLGVLGWGVGGIEAEAAMLGQPVSMLIPQVVGFRLHGKLREGATATDLVLTVTEMLRKKGVVGKFVEFFGPGLAALPLADRATIANMAPEYGATCGIFPGRRRDAALPAPHGTLGRRQSSWSRPTARSRVCSTARRRRKPTTPSVAELDLATRRAEPRRPEAAAGPRQPVQGAEVLRGCAPQPRQAARRRRAPAVRCSTATPDVGYAPASRPSPDVKNGSVVIAAITSCTNTSNPSVMIAAGLLAKKAVERGLTTKPWVKTCLAPGSKVVTEYLAEAGLTPYLEQLRFHLVGYGCTTCIGNCGPLPQPVADAIEEGELVVAACCRGNRNFEGRINPEVRANYLVSPPLVVAYALAGRIDIDLDKEPLGEGKGGAPVYLRDIWPTANGGRTRSSSRAVKPEMFQKTYADVFEGDERWRKLDVPPGDLRLGSASTYVKQPPYFDGMHQDAGRGDGHQRRARAGGAGRQRHDRPHLAGGLDQEGRPGRPVPDRPRRRGRRTSTPTAPAAATTR